MEKESPYLKLREFEKVCTTINLQNISVEQLKLKLLPLSMKDRVSLLFETELDWMIGQDAKRISKVFLLLTSKQLTIKADRYIPPE